MGAFTSQLFGVSEPTLFGVLIRYNFRPLIVTVLTSGLGAAVLSILNVSANSYGLAVVPSYLMYIYNGHALLWYTIVSLGTIVVAFVATNAFAIPKEVLAPDRDVETANAVISSTVSDNKVYAPVSGETLALNKVSDPVFASGMMGDGLAIKPENASVNKIYAPQSGTLSVVADTGHAYGLTSDDGMEILVHLGIDTVNLHGAPFTVAVKAGQHVNKGDLLGTMDRAAIEKAGLDPTTMVLITNSKAYARIEPVADTTVKAGADLLAVQREDVKVESVSPASL